MVLLRKSWDDITVQLIVNCFLKADFFEKLREHAMDEDYYPFGSLCTDVDDSVADLEFNLDRLLQVNPELAPGELDAAGLIGIDACISMNQLQALTEKK